MKIRYAQSVCHSKFFLSFIWLLFLWPNIHAQTLPDLGQGIAIEVNGKSVSTTTKFSGGISLNSALYQTKVTQNLVTPVEITGEITVDPLDIGKTADIFVYADTVIPPSEDVMYFMLGRDSEENLIIPQWDKTPANLEAFIRQINLVEHQSVPMYSGTFYYPGTLKVHFGYRLESGTIIYNEQPIDIMIELIDSPKITQITATGPNTAKLTWSPMQMDLTYEIYVSQTPRFDPNHDTPYMTVEGTDQAELTELEPNTTYYILVVAKDKQANRSFGKNYQVVKTLPVTVPVYYSTPPEGTYFLGSEVIGKTVFQNLIIAEIGNAVLQVNFDSLTGTHANAFKVIPADFAFTITDGALPEVIQIQCIPAFVGEHTARLTIRTNDPARPTVGYTLQCNGVDTHQSPQPVYRSFPAPGETLNIITDSYGNPSTSVIQQITVIENGNADLEIKSAEFLGKDASAFKISSPVVPFNIIEGGLPQTLTIQCLPRNEELLTAELRLSTNDPTQQEVSYFLTCLGTTSTLPYPLTVILQGEGKIVSDPAGIDCGTDCTENYVSGSQITLTATANAKAIFKEWSGDCSGTTPSFSVTMDAAKTCTATFESGEPPPTDSLRPLTVTVQGTGKVTSDSPGIDCDMSGTNCVQNYPVNNQVTLTATSDTGAAFQEWSGACTGTTPSTSVTMDKAKICTAMFVDGPTIPYPLTIIVEGNGQVASTSVAGIDCGTDCTEAYLYGSSITLTATPSPDHFFDSWSGACAGMEPSITVDIDSTKECTATFDEIPSSYPLAITVDGAGQVDVQGNVVQGTRDTPTPCTSSYCSDNYVANESVILTAIGPSFKGWSGSEGCTGTSPVVNVIMNNENTTCSAIFSEGACPVSNTVSTCPNLDTIPVIPSDQAILTLGAGIDSDRDQPRPFSCLNGTTKMVGGSSVSMKVKAFSSYKEMLDYERKSVKGNLKASFNAINLHAGAEADFIKFYDTKSKSRSYIMKYELDMVQQFTPDPTAPLNQYGQSYTGNACEFKQYCGDQFVWQQNQGVKVYVAMSFSFDTAQAYREFTTKANAGIEGTFMKNYCDNGCLKKLPIPFSADLEAQLTKISTQTRKNGTLSITFLQQGGEPQKTAAKAGSAIKCKLDQMSTCKEAFNKVVEYMGSEEFIEDAKASPVIFNSTYSSYPFIPDVPALPSDLTPEIENAREQLVAEYVKRKLARDKAQSLLDNTCYSSRQAQIEPLAQRLENDVTTLEQTIDGCFSDLSHCVENKCKSFQTLQPYDLSTVEFQPEELLGCGLVAYYPFDGDANDQVSTNTGELVKGPYLVDGVSGQAYQFNGESDHIGMKRINADPASDFTISTWFKIEKYNQNPDNEDKRSAILDLRGDGGSENKSYALLIGRGDGGSSKLVHRSDWPKPNGYNFNINVGDARNTWHHTALVREGGSLRIYYDGINQQKDEEVGTELLRWNDWRVGKRYEFATFPGVSDPGNFAFNGAIDQIRIYNRALSDEEIGKLFELKK